MRCSTSYTDQGLKMQEHLKFQLFFTLKSYSGPGKSLHRQSNFLWSLHRPCLLQSRFSPYTVLLQCLRRAIPQDYRKTQFFKLFVGLAKPQARATCMPRSGANRSAFHYNPLRVRLNFYDFANEWAYNLLQIGCQYDSLYAKKIERLQLVRDI
jgi:hypothetical protein